MVEFTNLKNIPLALAVWLVDDDYDYINDPKYISVTTLLKSPRQIILSKRLNKMPDLQRQIDISRFVKSSIGTSCHSAIELAWTKNYRENLSKLGIPEKVIDTIRINPTPEEAKEEGIIPLYLEVRNVREIKGWKVGGKFDMIFEGILMDTKSTSTYTYEKGIKDDDYRAQGSIYAWLNQDKVTFPYLRINYIFTDWSEARALRDDKYPQASIIEYPIKLWDTDQTEQFIKGKLAQLDALANTPEPELPRCSDEDLWRSDFVWKYYKNPANKARSTKNFDTEAEAIKRFYADGKIGEVVRSGGEVKACKYCNAYDICTQKDEYLNSGELIITE